MSSSTKTRNELLRQIEVIRAQLERLEAADNWESDPKPSADSNGSLDLEARPFATAAMAVIEWDAKRRVRRWSANAEFLFGWTAEEVLGLPWNELGLVHEEDVERIQPISERLITGAADFHASSNRNRRKDGSVIQCEWFNSIVRDEGGHVLSMLSLVRDITDPPEQFTTVASRLPLSPERVGDAMQLVFQSTARKTRDEFFRSVVRSLSEVMQCRYALLARTDPETPGQATILAWIADGELQQNESYELAGSPCAEVREQKLCLHNEHLQELFPEDRLLVQLDAHCYAGTPVVDSAGETRGILAILDSRPREFGPDVVAILELFGDRVAEEFERIRVEDSLRASESMYRNLFEMSPSAVFVLADERIVFANPAALEMVRAPRLRAMIDTSFLERVHDDDRERLARCLKAASRSGPPSPPIEIRIRGGEEWIDIEFRASAIEFGGRAAVFGMAVDITQRKRIENDLRLTQISVDHNVVGVLWVKPSGRFVYANQAIANLLGYTQEEMLDRHAWEIDAEREEQGETQIWTQLRDVGSVQFETHLRCKSGELTPVSIAGTYEKFGGEEYAFAFVSDLRDQRRAEGSLRESQTQYRNLLENMTDAVYRYEFKPEPRFAFISQSITAMTGYTPEEHYADPLLGQKVIHPDDRHLLDEKIKDRTSQAEPVVVRWIRKDGQLIWTEPRNIPIFDEQGELIAVEGVARDVTRRQLAEAAEQESERRLHELQIVAGVGDFTWDIRTGAVHWSDSLFQLLGYEPQPITFAFVRDSVFHPEDLVAIERWLEDCLAADADVLTPFEFRLVKQNGAPIFIRSVGVIERDASGNGVMVFGTLQDITRRKTAEVDLLRANAELQQHHEELESVVQQRTAELSAAVAKSEESEKRLSAILDNTSMLIGLCAADGSVLRANHAVVETVGGTEGDFIGRFLWETPDWPEDVRNSVKEAFERASKGEFARHELRQRRSDGSIGVLDFSISPIRDETGGISFLIPEGRDITQIKAIERRLRLTQASVDGAGDAVFWLDRAGSLYYVNEAACTSLGYNQEELLALDANDIDPRRAANQIPELKEELERTGSATIESIHRRKDGTTFPVDITVRRLQYEGEQFSIAIARDVTERKRYQENLEDAIEQAQAADRLKTAFLANMSHELRTPLNSILGFSGILQQEISGKLNDEQMKQVAVVEQNAEHLLSLINNVLDISKIEAGQFAVCAAAFEISESVDRVVEMVRPLADKAGLKLSIASPPDLGSSVGDRLRFEQILINLLTNAIRFTPQGEVTLRGRVEEDAMVWQVCDTGVGIRSEDLPKLFKPFLQLDSDSDRNHDGTGLGLAISQRLARLMGGDISVESVRGEGSVFTLRLPLSGLAHSGPEMGRAETGTGTAAQPSPESGRNGDSSREG